MSNFFENKSVIVTGATSGMGRQIALDLAKKGANIIANGRNLQAGNSLEMEADGSVHFVPGDIADPNTSKALAFQSMEKFAYIDMVVMSAGELGIGKITEVDIDVWHQTFATNVHSVYYLLKEVLPLMQQGGSIVLIGSIAAFHAFPNHPAYCASKGALVSLVKQIALDYGPDVRINLICPAQVKTPLLENSLTAFPNPEQILTQTANRLPLKRLGTTTDISSMAQFLLSEESAWVTGSYFIIDGGFLAT